MIETASQIRPLPGHPNNPDVTLDAPARVSAGGIVIESDESDDSFLVMSWQNMVGIPLLSPLTIQVSIRLKDSFTTLSTSAKSPQHHPFHRWSAHNEKQHCFCSCRWSLILWHTRGRIRRYWHTFQWMANIWRAVVNVIHKFSIGVCTTYYLTHVAAYKNCHSTAHQATPIRLPWLMKTQETLFSTHVPSWNTLDLPWERIAASLSMQRSKQRQPKIHHIRTQFDAVFATPFKKTRLKYYLVYTTSKRRLVQVYA